MSGRETEEAVRTMLDAAREGPSPERLARIEQGLGPLLDGGSGGTPPAGAGGSAWTKGLLGGGALLALGGVVAWVLTSGTPEERAPATAASEPTAQSAAAAAPDPEPVEAPAAIAPAPDPEPEPEAVPEQPGPPAARRNAPTRPPMSEAELLLRAHGAMRHDPEEALALTRLHRRHFPRGEHAQEREVLVVDALFRLGRDAEARRRAEAFLRRHPGSAHRHGVEQMLHDHNGGAAPATHPTEAR